MARMKPLVYDSERCIECNGCVTACKNENEVPWGVNRRRVVTLNDGLPGEKSISVACMHCPTRPAWPCPVQCFYRTEEGGSCTTRTSASAAATARTPVPFGAPQFLVAGHLPRARGKMDKCTFCAGGPEANGSARPSSEKYGRNRLAEGKPAGLRRDVLSTKALLAGDGDVVADIFRHRRAASRHGRRSVGLGHGLRSRSRPARRPPERRSEARGTGPRGHAPGAWCCWRRSAGREAADECRGRPRYDAVPSSGIGTQINTGTVLTAPGLEGRRQDGMGAADQAPPSNGQNEYTREN